MTPEEKAVLDAAIHWFHCGCDADRVDSAVAKLLAVRQPQRWVADKSLSDAGPPWLVIDQTTRECIALCWFEDRAKRIARLMSQDDRAK